MEFDVFTVISRIVHLAAVIVAIGGAAFMLFVGGPAAGTVLDDAAHERLRDAVRQRWRRFVHACIGLLLVTGLVNAYVAIHAGRPAAYLVLFVVKFLAALGVFFVASALAGRNAAFEPLRRNPRPWLGLVVAGAGLIVVLAGIMHAMPPET